jgi:hypothetical protein
MSNTSAIQGADMSLSAHVLAINAGSAATVKTTGAIIHLANGQLKSKGILSAQALTAPTSSTVKTTGATMTVEEAQQWAFYTIPAGKTAYVVVALDNGANVVTLMGTYDGQPLGFRGAGSAVGKSVLPVVPLGLVPFGVIKIVGGTATWAPGDALDKANVTFTFRDYGLIPAGTTF